MSDSLYTSTQRKPQSTQRTQSTSVPRVYYHNFVVNKKNVDGKLLLQNFKIQSHSVNSTKLQNHRRKLLFAPRQKHSSIHSNFPEQYKSKKRSQSSQGYREKPAEYKLVVKQHMKTSQETFLFKKSIDLREKFMLVQNPEHLHKILKQRKLQSRNRLLEFNMLDDSAELRQSSQPLNSQQCKVQKCNLLAKFLFETSSAKRKQESIIRKTSLSRGKKNSQVNKVLWKKTLNEFLPKLTMYNQANNLEKDLQLNNFSNSQKKKLEFPLCKAKCFTVLLNNTIIFSKNGQEKREIASLTKIMTCITALFLVERFQINWQRTQVKVSREAINLGGTTANLKFGDILTLKDLLYGMMLPSGNDAAFAIAEYFGRLLYKKSPQYEQKVLEFIKMQQTVKNNMNDFSAIANSNAKNATSLALSHQKFSFISSLQAVQYFTQQMNAIARHLNMQKTFFTNPHGLSDPKNRSTSNDMINLAYHCMKQNERFSAIVQTKFYESKIFNKNTKMMRLEKWMNSNLSLFDNDGLCYGIKTGNTPNAGPCLASYFKTENIEVTIILLSSETKEDRFKQVEYIFETVIKSGIINTISKRKEVSQSMEIYEDEFEDSP